MIAHQVVKTHNKDWPNDSNTYPDNFINVKRIQRTYTLSSALLRGGIANRKSPSNSLCCDSIMTAGVAGSCSGVSDLDMALLGPVMTLFNELQNLFF